MASESYYFAYEERYKKVFKTGIDRWGHSPDDETLVSTIKKWVLDNGLQNKRIIEFACGEGACGEILSELGCIYHGVDISLSAVERARKAVERFPCASVSCLDMVNESINGIYDAAVDIMGFHMLVLDADRIKYLKNVFNCLKNGSPIIFFRESYRADVPSSNEVIESMSQWITITGDDYITPQKRYALQNGINMEVNIPLVPARARDKKGYIREFSDAGFLIDDFVEMNVSNQIITSASIYAHKPTE